MLLFFLTREHMFSTIIVVLGDVYKRQVDMNYLIGKKESTEIIPDSYYLNPEARDMAQFLFENPEYKVLFDASRKVKPEDIQFVKEMIEIGAHKRNGNHYESVCSITSDT